MLALLLFFSVATAGDADLSFLSGDWRQCTDGGFVEERWLGPRDGLAVGANLTSRNGRSAFEHLRIERDENGWTYWASPAGKAPVPFKLVEFGGQRAVFANPDHGFPARILYAREGAELVARIEGEIGGTKRAQSWRFAPGTGSDCDRR